MEARTRPFPVVSRDTEFFWEGTRRGELLIQRCTQCETLRHVPRPMCPNCRSFEWDAVAATGRGTVYSWVVHEHPSIPGFELPLVLVLVDLEEGVRMAGALLDVDTSEVEIGMPVGVTFEAISDSCVLPQWRRAGAARP